MPARASLNVSLTPELTAWIAAQVSSGRFRSASEVVRASLRLLQDAAPPPAPARSGGPRTRRQATGTAPR